jgi:hypothetical protein
MSQEKKCNTCKKGLSQTNIILIILSWYILGTSIYGSIILFKNLLSIFW